MVADAVDGTKIADDAIGSEHIADNAVIEARIASNAVTSAKIAASAVDTSELNDGPQLQRLRLPQTLLMELRSQIMQLQMNILEMMLLLKQN